MSRMKLVTVTVALTAAFSVARSAAAQTCSEDKDCPQSFACVDSGSSVGGTRPACPPNTPCDQPADLAPAKPQIVKSCQAKACVADADCGTGMVCFEEKSATCSGGAAVAPCAPGADCPRIVPSEPNCVTTSRRQCAFKWQVPCNTDAACGDGFTCQPQESGSCSSSGGPGTATPATDAGTAGGSTGSTGSGNSAGIAADPAKPGTGTSPPSSDPMCTVTKTFPGYCQPKVTHCAADSDCPTTWTCTQQATPVTDPPPPRPGTSADGGSAPKGASEPAPPDQGFVPAPAVRTCTPPGGLGVRASDSAGGKGEVSTPMSPGSGSTAGGPQPLPQDPKGPPSSGAPGQSAAPSSGGCTIHDGNQSSRASGLALFTLLGLLAARRMRRR